MVYFTHSLTSPELVLEFVEEYSGYFFYRLYRDPSHPIFKGISDLGLPSDLPLEEQRRIEHTRTSYALIYHKEKGFRFMEESDLFKRAYDVDPGLFFMIDYARAKQKCNDKTPPPGLFRQYTSNKFDDAKIEVMHTRKLLKRSPRFNLNGLRLGQTRGHPLHDTLHCGKFQFYNNLVVTPIATHYHSPPLDLEGIDDFLQPSAPKGAKKVEEIGKRKREQTVVDDSLHPSANLWSAKKDDMGLHYFPQNYASSAEYYIQCGDHALSITYSNGYFW
jgi:hypothetical protein